MARSKPSIETLPDDGVWNAAISPMIRGSTWKRIGSTLWVVAAFQAVTVGISGFDT